MNHADELKSSGLKATLPRIKILEVFQRAQRRHMTAEDVYKALLTEGSDIGLATVYRVLMQFEQAGLLTRSNFESGKSVFELDEGQHHERPRGPVQHEAREIGRMERDHAHADHVFPEKGVGEEVLAEHDLLPDGSGDHDRVEHERLDDHGDVGGGESIAGAESAGGVTWVPRSGGSSDQRIESLAPPATIRKKFSA